LVFRGFTLVVKVGVEQGAFSKRGGNSVKGAKTIRVAVEHKKTLLKQRSEGRKERGQREVYRERWVGKGGTLEILLIFMNDRGRTEV